MIVVGISGKLQSGKSAIAEHLVERWGFTQMSMADALREEVLARLPRTLSELHRYSCPRYDVRFGEGDNRPRRRPCLEGNEAECIREMVYQRKPPGVRELLQEYGTEVRRHDQPDYWVERWWERVDALPERSCVVVPDIRFGNEARAILARGGRLWRVERPGTAQGDHVSETEMDGWSRWNAVLQNAGTLADLHARVDALAASVETDHPLHAGPPHLVGAAALDPAV